MVSGNCYADKRANLSICVNDTITKCLVYQNSALLFSTICTKQNVRHRKDRHIVVDGLI